MKSLAVVFLSLAPLLCACPDTQPMTYQDRAAIMEVQRGVQDFQRAITPQYQPYYPVQQTPRYTNCSPDGFGGVNCYSY